MGPTRGWAAPTVLEPTSPMRPREVPASIGAITSQLLAAQAWPRFQERPARGHGVSPEAETMSLSSRSGERQRPGPHEASQPRTGPTSIGACPEATASRRGWGRAQELCLSTSSTVRMSPTLTLWTPVPLLPGSSLSRLDESRQRQLYLLKLSTQ